MLVKDLVARLLKSVLVLRVEIFDLSVQSRVLTFHDPSNSNPNQACSNLSYDDGEAGKISSFLAM